MRSTLLFIIVIFLLAGCSLFPRAASPTPTLPPTREIPAYTPVPTVTRPAFPTPFSSVEVNTPYPTPAQKILPENISLLKELAHWGLGVIQYMTLSSDGKKAAVSTPQGTYLYDLDTLQQVRLLAATGLPVFSPDGRLLAAAGGVWQTSSGERVTALETRRSVQWKFTPDGSAIAIASGGAIEFRSSNDGKIIQTLTVKTGNAIYDFAVSPGGDLVAVGLSDGSAQVFKTSGSEVFSVQPEADAKTSTALLMGVQAVAFSTDGKLFAAATGNGISIYHLPEGSWLRNIKSGAYRLAFSPDGSSLAASDESETIRLWNPVDGKLLHELAGHLNGIKGMAYLPDASTLITAAGDGVIRFWQTRDGKLLKSLAYHSSATYQAVFSPDSKKVASSSCQGIEMRQAANGKLNYRAGEGCVTALAFSSNGQWLAAASPIKEKTSSTTQSLALWNAADGRLIRPFQGLTGPVRSLSFSPDDSLLTAAGSGSEDAYVRVWKVSDGSLVTAINHEGALAEAAFSPDGKLLAARTPSRLLVWQVGDFKLLYQQSLPSILVNLVFAPKGQSLAVADGTSFRLLNPKDGQLLYLFKSAEATCLAYSPDGQLLAMGQPDGSIQIWRSFDWKLAYTLRGPKDSITSLSFSADGWLLSSSAQDGIVRIWGIR